MAKKYKSPKPDNKVFTKYWDIFLPEVMARENFKPVHLHQLEILCDLYVEYHSLLAIVEIEGYTYVSVGRNGEQQRPTAEVNLLSKCRIEIRNYCKMLGIALVKDSGAGNNTEEEEWD
jgi:phage terminase small subunit